MEDEEENMGLELHERTYKHMEAILKVCRAIKTWFALWFVFIREKKSDSGT